MDIYRRDLLVSLWLTNHNVAVWKPPEVTLQVFGFHLLEPRLLDGYGESVRLQQFHEWLHVSTYRMGQELHVSLTKDEYWYCQQQKENSPFHLPVVTLITVDAVLHSLFDLVHHNVGEGVSHDQSFG